MSAPQTAMQRPRQRSRGVPADRMADGRPDRPRLRRLVHAHPGLRRVADVDRGAVRGGAAHVPQFAAARNPARAPDALGGGEPAVRHPAVVAVDSVRPFSRIAPDPPRQRSPDRSDRRPGIELRHARTRGNVRSSLPARHVPAPADPRRSHADRLVVADGLVPGAAKPGRLRATSPACARRGSRTWSCACRSSTGSRPSAAFRCWLYVVGDGGPGQRHPADPFVRGAPRARRRTRAHGDGRGLVVARAAVPVQQPALAASRRSRRCPGTATTPGTG